MSPRPRQLEHTGRLTKKGFTLVELLVVVAIIVIIATVLVPRFIDYTERTRQARAEADIKTMFVIVEAYAADEGQGRYPISSNDSTVSNSIAAVMQKRGIKWTGDATGITDPWGQPYHYAHR
jgi:general secretion pathway protein G